jgi:hypothetical protein
MTNPLIGCVMPFGLAMLLLSAVWPAGSDSRNTGPTFANCASPRLYLVLQRFGKSCAVNRLSFAALIAADGAFGGKELMNTFEHLKHLVETMDTGIASARDRVATVAERCSAGLTRYAS